MTVTRRPCQDAAPAGGLPPATGDLNGDAVLDAADLYLLGMLLADGTPAAPCLPHPADLDGDRRLTLMDGMLLAGRIMGIC